MCLCTSSCDKGCLSKALRNGGMPKHLGLMPLVVFLRGSDSQNDYAAY